MPRSKSGEQVGAVAISATDAKNRFGLIMKKIKTGPVFIVKHGTPKAVVLAMDAYTALLNKARDRSAVQLDALRDEFDALYSKMQTGKSRSSVDALLSTSADGLNEVARKRTKRRG